MTIKILPSRNVEMAFPMVVPKGTFKPIWEDSVQANIAELEKLLKDPTLHQVATHVRSKVKHTIWACNLNDYDVIFVVAPLDKDSPEMIQYCVKVAHIEIKGTQDFKTCSQVSLWRNANYLQLPRGFAVWVFKEILFPIYGKILSDYTQTLDGKRFWVTQIQEELEMGTHVYALTVKGNGKPMLQVSDMVEITDANEVPKFYTDSPDDSGIKYRFLLSKKQLEV